MKIQLNTPDKVAVFVDIFRNLKNIVSSINIIFSPEKLYIQGMDDSHICLVELSIINTWFDEFESEDIVIGINSEILFKIINGWKEGYNITLCAVNADTLNISFEGSNMLTKNYSIPLMDLEYELINVPTSDYDVDLIMNSQELRDVINELSIFNDKLTVICTSDKVNFKASGDYGTADIEIKDDDILEYSVAIEDNCSISMSFGIKNLLHACNFHKINKELNLHINKNQPFKISYNIDSESFVRFFIAPNIEDE